MKIFERDQQIRIVSEERNQAKSKVVETDKQLRDAIKENEKWKDHTDKLKERMEVLRKANQKLSKKQQNNDSNYILGIRLSPQFIAMENSLKAAEGRIHELESSLSVFINDFEVQN